ncbi:MAG: tetratricopeptide repeat protein [Dehalococcoidia bacterium]
MIAPNRHFFWIAALALAFTYSGMRHNEAAYDDPTHIVGNPGIRSLSNLPRLFTGDYIEVSRDRKAYRPAAVALRILAYPILQDNINGYRWINLTLHWLNACLLFLLCRRYFFPDPSPVPFWAGLIFALHPVGSECILCATFLYAPLALLFCQAAFLAYLGAREAVGRQRLAWGACSWLAFTLALLSKETAALFPLWVAAYEGLAPRTASRPGWWRKPLFAAYFAALLPYLGIRLWLFGEYAQAPYIGGSFYSNFLTSLKTIPLYTRLLFWPHPLSINYRITAASSWREPEVLAALAIVCALALWAANRWRTDKVSLFWLFGLLWPLGVVMNWVPFFDEVLLANERRLYFSLAAFAVLLASGLSRLASLRPTFGGRLGTGVAALLLLCSSVITIRRVPDWRSAVTLHEQAVGLNARNYKALNDLGWAYHQTGQLARAESTYRSALAVFPGIVTCIRLAAVYEDRGKIPEALALLRAALGQADSLSIRHYRMREQTGRLWFRLGNIRWRSGDFPEAAAAYAQAVEMDPSLDAAYHNLGLAYAASGRTGEAASALRKALALNPGNDKASALLRELERK